MLSTHYPLKQRTLNGICNINSNSRIVETPGGHAVIQPDLKPDNGVSVLAFAFGQMFFARVVGKSLVTEDGDVLEGEVLDEVTVEGVVTFFINGTEASADDCPVM